MTRYVIGVDGGNSKTDYFLFDTNGSKVDAIRSGTCSHEALGDGFAGSRRVLAQEIDRLLSRNGLALADVAAACFGLAGVDVPGQKEALEKIVREIGLGKFVVCNDGFLGIKAGTRSGMGVCSINGTATVAVGIDRQGNWIQVGGIGMVSGDQAGGAFLARKVVEAVYREAFLFGPPTSMTDALFALLGVSDKHGLSNGIVEKFVGRKVEYADLVKLLFSHANEGDEVAIGIVRNSGESMARGVAGCIAHLDLPEPVEVVLAGSVWAKASSSHLLESFRHWLGKLAETRFTEVVLQVPPATGAIIWALELVGGNPPPDQIRERIIRDVRVFQEGLESGAESPQG